MRPLTPRRLHAQRLVGDPLPSGAAVVHHLGAVQSQLPDLALWTLARRTDGVTLADLQTSFDRGDFLRTHVLRPTWHFVAPEDVHWLLALTAPRIRAQLRSANKPIGLTDDVLDRGAALVLEVLADGRPHQRKDIAARLADAGLELTGQGVAHVVMHAEIERLVVNGPMQGRQHTYTLLPAAEAPVAPRDELLADVARRYVRGHGPVRDKDLAWWASLTLTDSRRALAAADLTPLEVDGQTFWTDDDPVDADVPAAMLLSTFDEYISYAREPDDYATYAGRPDDVVRGSGLLHLDGRLGGLWTRTVKAATVHVQVEVRDATRSTLSAGARSAIEADAERFAAFVGRDLDLTVVA